MQDENDNIERTPIQFRISDTLRELIDEDAEKFGLSRNEWLAEVVDEFITNGDDPVPCEITATALLSNRKAVMVRLPDSLVEIIDELAEESEVTRTVWLMDAVLTSLAINA